MPPGAATEREGLAQERRNVLLRTGQLRQPVNQLVRLVKLVQRTRQVVLGDGGPAAQQQEPEKLGLLAQPPRDRHCMFAPGHVAGVVVVEVLEGRATVEHEVVHSLQPTAIDEHWCELDQRRAEPMHRGPIAECS